jgi:hypothetical protein
LAKIAGQHADLFEVAYRRYRCEALWVVTKYESKIAHFSQELSHGFICK